MKAMILAAGFGERMRPLTDTTPKPLLQVNEKPLIQYHIERLVAAGVTELVVNVAWLGEQLKAFLGDGSAFGATISISDEGSPLETAGGIQKALPLLGEEPFMVLNGDVWTDYDFASLAARDLGEADAHLVLVPNPAQHPEGDFALQGENIQNEGKQRFTFAGVGLYAPRFFAGLPPGSAPLAPLIRASADAGRVSGEFYGGLWFDIGTPERLGELDNALRARKDPG